MLARYHAEMGTLDYTMRYQDEYVDARRIGQGEYTEAKVTETD